jgi:hypothetical protein
MQTYDVRFRDDRWWIVNGPNWFGPYREPEVAQSLAVAIARRAVELGVPTSVVAHHKDGSEETVWDGIVG